MIARLKRSSRRLTVPHVLSALALFVALGGTAVAVGIAKNSVGSPQIKRGGVNTSDIADSAVTTAKLRSKAVTSAKVKNGTLSAIDINQASLTKVRAANVTTVSALGDGDCTLVGVSQPGVTSDSVTTGRCAFTFLRDVSACTATASVDLRLEPNIFLPAGARTAFARRNSAEPRVIETQTFYDASAGDGTPDVSDLPVTLTIVC